MDLRVAVLLAAVSGDTLLLIGPAIGIIVLLVLPFVAGEGEKSWKRRPIAVLTVMLIAVTLGTFTHLVGTRRGAQSWTRGAACRSHPNIFAARTALERQGALVFQVKQCHNCHALDDQGRKAWAGPRPGSGAA